MKQKIYSIGVDFGTLSARAVIVDSGNGAEIANSVYAYPHGVMDRHLPCGKKLPDHWALQHPQDYWDALIHSVSTVVTQSGIAPSQIAALGIDCTASTLIPVDAQGNPLCNQPCFQCEPHAYAKLWKHHAAQTQADRLTQVALETDQPFLANCGGKVSSECTYPKLLELLEGAPSVYHEMADYCEAADWLVWRLTGNRFRNACCASYKAYYDPKTGYPSPAYFEMLHPDFGRCVQDKLNAPVIASGTSAGPLLPAAAELLCLSAGTPVSAPTIDAHVCVPASGIAQAGDMLGILGTSGCFMLLSDQYAPVPGIFNVVQDGLFPGFYGYEAGLSCVGDLFAWGVSQYVHPDDYHAANAAGQSIYEYLSLKASLLAPGETGLLALGWWNGNRSTLNDAQLSGLMLGMTMQTTAAHLFRALLESTAFGARRILENFRNHGVAVNRLFVTGSIARKNPFAIQLYADILNIPVHVIATSQCSALGSAIFASVAAGIHADIRAASMAMHSPVTVVYSPVPENVEIYQTLYLMYEELAEMFGRQPDSLMKRLLQLKAEQTR